MNQPTETIILGGGCFWCLDATFRLVKGIKEVVCGYSGGETENPTYEEVCSSNTGHIEVIKLSFDPQIIDLSVILNIFFTLHDPTSLARQGYDVGYQYSSAIFYFSKQQKKVIEQVYSKFSKIYQKPLVTIIQPFKNFYPAENYHQDYFNKNPSQSYCQMIINPKILKLKNKYASYLL
jgi:peptide-methionine (S)-S-oxide reductase